MKPSRPLLSESSGFQKCAIAYQSHSWHYSQATSRSQKQFRKNAHSLSAHWDKEPSVMLLSDPVFSRPVSKDVGTLEFVPNVMLYALWGTLSHPDWNKELSVQNCPKSIVSAAVIARRFFWPHLRSLRRRQQPQHRAAGPATAKSEFCQQAGGSSF